MREHGVEPVRGLPAALPKGETLLWQGAPRWRPFARRAFHLRKLAIYFAVLLAWYIASVATGAEDAWDALLGTLRVAGLAAGALGLVALFSWLIERSTVYTITSRRLVMRFGVAFPMTLNLPFRLIQSAGLREYADGTGDIPLALLPEGRVSYPILWPHVRPWRMARTEPMLRAIPDAARVAQVLGRALAASAEQPAPAASEAIASGAGPRPRATAAA